MRRLTFLACLLFALAGPTHSFAQAAFKVIPTTVAVAEGATANILLIELGDAQFSVRIPAGYGIAVREESRSILFTSADGASRITVQVTTNYPRALPPSEDVKEAVVRKYPGARVLQCAPCVSDYGRGLYVDLVKSAPNDLSLRIQDAYVPFAAGSFEFILSCNGGDYDRNRLGFVRLLNSFRSQPKAAKKDL